MCSFLYFVPQGARSLSLIGREPCAFQSRRRKRHDRASLFVHTCCGPFSILFSRSAWQLAQTWSGDQLSLRGADYFCPLAARGRRLQSSRCQRGRARAFPCHRYPHLLVFHKQLMSNCGELVVCRVWACGISFERTHFSQTGSL